MRFPRALLALASLGLLAGCATSPEQELEGAWTVDGAKTVVPNVPWPLSKERLTESLSSMTLKLRPGGKFVLVSGQSVEGTWKLSKGTVILQPDLTKESKRTQSWILRASQSSLKSGGDPQNVPLKVGPDRKTLTLEEKTPVGIARAVLVKTG